MTDPAGAALVARWECCGKQYDPRGMAIREHCTVCHREFPQSYDYCPSDNQPWHRERAQGASGV